MVTMNLIVDQPKLISVSDAQMDTGPSLGQRISNRMLEVTMTVVGAYFVGSIVYRLFG